MKLAELSARILGHVQFNPELAPDELARILKTKAHVVRYRLHQLSRSGMMRAGALIDFGALGLTQFELFFSLSTRSTETRAKLIRYLERSGKVYWRATIGGDYQYGCTIVAKDAHEAFEFVESAAKGLGATIVKKAIAAVVEFTTYRKKYLNPGLVPSAGDAITVGRTRRRVEISESDRKIIGALYTPASRSHQEISRYTGIARTTVEYRLRKLESEKIIHRRILFVSAGALGRQTYRLLIFGKGIDPQFRAGLAKFALAERSVVLMLTMLGAWDIELAVEVAQPNEIIDIVERLHEKFGAAISDISILPLFEQSITSNFLDALKNEG